MHNTRQIKHKTDKDVTNKWWASDVGTPQDVRATGSIRWKNFISP